MKIAIHENLDIFNHSTSWNKEWEKYCKQKDISFGIVNCFNNEILSELAEYDILLWHFNNYSLQEMLYARTILLSAKAIGLKTFPDFDTSWHFDDKISETYLLKTIDAPIPNSWVFYTLDDALNFFNDDCKYPLIAKLRSGSGSNNVTMLKNKRDAVKYAKKMFKNGINSSPNVFYKTSSNIKSSKNLETILKRFRRIPDFIESIKKAKMFSKEKGYVYIQEFIPNDGFDLKVVVVGDKASFLARDIRSGDFRASGGGIIKYDKEYISKEILDIAFEVSKKLNFQCMGYDFVVDKRENEAKIIEISYGFSHTAQINLGGHWTSDGDWVEKPLNAPAEIIRNLVNNG